MTSLFPPFNRRSSFRKQPYFYEAGRGVNYKSTGGPFPTLDLNFLSGTLDPRITFSRASNATLTDSTGKITYAPNNLLLQSQTFTDASWGKASTGITANALVAPDGTNTGSKFYPTVSAGRVFQAVTTLGASVFSFYAKAGEMTAVNIRAPNNGVVAIAYLDLTNGTVSGVNTTYGSAGAVAVGNGWYRFYFYLTASLNNISFAPCDAVGNTASTPSGTNGIYIWGAQLEAVTYQTTPSTYNATTTAAYYGPRFDYDPVTLSAKGLLIEEARTNSLLQSENFAASWSLLRMTVSADATTSPSGTTTADQLLDTAVAGTHVAIQTITKAASSLAYTASVYLKANVRTLGELRMSDQSGNGVRNTFNLSAGTIGSPSTFGTGFAATGSTITNVGNGWYRVDVSCTTNTATTLGHEVYIADASGNTSYTGNGSGFYAWGAQLEAGAFATSYIPTVASSVARSADIATMTGTNFSSWFNQGPVNLVLQSQTFDNASWLKQAGAVVTANTTIAPDGTLTADTLTNVNGVASVGILQNIAVSATTYTMQFSVQAGTSNTAFFGFFIGAGFATGTPTILSGPGSVSGTSFCTLSGLSSTQWTRVAFTFTSSAGTGNFYIYPETAGVGTGKNVIIWGAQLEVGSTATSYIPTTTVPVASPPAVGTFSVKGDVITQFASNKEFFTISDAGATNLFRLSADNTASRPQFAVVTGGVTQANLFNTSFTLTANVSYTAAEAFATNDFAMSTNGSAVDTDTSGQIPAVSLFYIGSNVGVNRYLNGHLQYIKYYPTRLPNTQLVSLTQPSLTPSMQLVFDTSSTSFTDANWSP